MIHVIIPVFNRINLTRQCILSIKKQKIYKELNIIIVDDASKDKTKKYLLKNFPEITVIDGPGNLFWGGAISLGINYVMKIKKHNDWVLLVNNDVKLSLDSIINLVKIAENKNRKVLAGSMAIDVNNSSTVVKSGTIVESWLFNKTSHVFKGLNINQIINTEPVKVDFLTARCLLHPVEIFKIAGNYDSKAFLHYGGDDEFSMRVKKYGYSTLLCPNSIVFLNSDDYRRKRKLSFKNFMFTFFNIKSSSNVINKFKLSIKVVPFYAKLTFFIIGVLKSFYIFLKR